MKLFNQSWLVLVFLILLLIILAFYPNGYVFMATSLIGSLVIMGFVYKVLKDDEPVLEGIDFE